MLSLIVAWLLPKNVGYLPPPRQIQPPLVLAPNSSVMLSCPDAVHLLTHELRAVHAQAEELREQSGSTNVRLGTKLSESDDEIKRLRVRLEVCAHEAERLAIAASDDVATQRTLVEATRAQLDQANVAARAAAAALSEMTEANAVLARRRADESAQLQARLVLAEQQLVMAGRKRVAMGVLLSAALVANNRTGHHQAISQAAPAVAVTSTSRLPCEWANVLLALLGMFGVSVVPTACFAYRSGARRVRDACASQQRETALRTAERIQVLSLQVATATATASEATERADQVQLSLHALEEEYAEAEVRREAEARREAEHLAVVEQCHHDEAKRAADELTTARQELHQLTSRAANLCDDGAVESVVRAALTEAHRTAEEERKAAVDQAVADATARAKVCAESELRGALFQAQMEAEAEAAASDKAMEALQARAAEQAAEDLAGAREEWAVELEAVVMAERELAADEIARERVHWEDEMSALRESLPYAVAAALSTPTNGRAAITPRTGGTQEAGAPIGFAMGLEAQPAAGPCAVPGTIAMDPPYDSSAGTESRFDLDEGEDIGRDQAISASESAVGDASCTLGLSSVTSLQMDLRLGVLGAGEANARRDAKTDVKAEELSLRSRSNSEPQLGGGVLLHNLAADAELGLLAAEIKDIEETNALAARQIVAAEYLAAALNQAKLQAELKAENAEGMMRDASVRADAAAMTLASTRASMALTESEVDADGAKRRTVEVRAGAAEKVLRERNAKLDAAEAAAEAAQAEVRAHEDTANDALSKLEAEAAARAEAEARAEAAKAAEVQARAKLEVAEAAAKALQGEALAHEDAANAAVSKLEAEAAAKRTAAEAAAEAATAEVHAHKEAASAAALKLEAEAAARVDAESRADTLHSALHDADISQAEAVAEMVSMRAQLLAQASDACAQCDSLSDELTIARANIEVVNHQAALNIQTARTDAETFRGELARERAEVKSVRAYATADADSARADAAAIRAELCTAQKELAVTQAEISAVRMAIGEANVIRQTLLSTMNDMDGQAFTIDAGLACPVEYLRGVVATFIVRACSREAKDVQVMIELAKVRACASYRHTVLRCDEQVCSITQQIGYE